MNKSDFQILLADSSNIAFEFAKRYVLDELPNNYLYSVHLNISYDSPDLKQFDIYPEDNGKIFEQIAAIKVVDLLCRNNKVPVWIDISVNSVYQSFTVFQLLCAGRYTSNGKEFYYSEHGTGSFGIKSPNLSFDYKEGIKFSLKANK